MNEQQDFQQSKWFMRIVWVLVLFSLIAALTIITTALYVVGRAIL